MRAMAQNQILPPTPTPSVHYSPQRTKPYSPQRSHNPSFSQTGNHNFVKIEEKSPVRFKNIENPQNHDDSLPAWAKSANSPSNDFSKISPIEKPHRNPSQDTDITTFADLPVPIRVSGVPKISLTSTQEINRTSIPEAHNLGKPKLVSSLIADQNNSPFKESNFKDTNFKEPELPSVKVLSSPNTSRKSVRRNILKSHSNSKSTSKIDSFGVDNAENAVEMSLLSNDSVRTKDLSVYLQKLLDGDKKYSKVNSFDDISEAIESSHRLVKSTQSSPRKSKKLQYTTDLKHSQSLDDSTLREDVRALVEQMLESSKQQSNQNARDKVAAVVSNSPRRHSKKYSKNELSGQSYSQANNSNPSFNSSRGKLN